MTKVSSLIPGVLHDIRLGQIRDAAIELSKDEFWTQEVQCHFARIAGYAERLMEEPEKVDP